MSRKYQGLIVLSTKSQEGSVEDLVKAVSKDFEAEGAKIEKVEQLGRREFAYSPRKVTAGHYVNYSFEGSPDAITKIQGRLKLNESVYTHQFQRLS